MSGTKRHPCLGSLRRKSRRARWVRVTYPRLTLDLPRKIGTGLARLGPVPGRHPRNIHVALPFSRIGGVPTMNVVPGTQERVPAHTASRVNQWIADQTRERLDYYRNHPSQVGKRLRELDREWDIERALEANAATIAFVGTSLAALHRKGWLMVPAIVTAFLFQHAVQGWCPPVPLLRRLGFRTAREIENERRALLRLNTGERRRRPRTYH